MSIITISRELAALGDETSKELSKRLGYRIVDKEALEENIMKYDRAGRFKKIDRQKPTLISSMSEDRDDYLHYLKSAVIDEAIEGNCIIVGRGAFAELEDVSDVLSVFLVSKIKSRVARVKNYFRCGEKSAHELIIKNDDDRSAFHKLFFEKTWKDPENYFFTLNTAELSPSCCAEIIKEYLKSVSSPESAAECSRRIFEMKTARNVVQHIRYEKHIGLHFLDAQAAGDTIKLYGIANSALMVEAATTAALEVPGVSRVDSEIRIVQEYAIGPYKI